MPDYIYLMENRLSSDQQHALRQLREAARERDERTQMAKDGLRLARRLARQITDDSECRARVQGDGDRTAGGDDDRRDRRRQTTGELVGSGSLASRGWPGSRASAGFVTRAREL